MATQERASSLQIQIIIPKITTICVGYGAVFFGLSLVKKRKEYQSEREFVTQSFESSKVTI